jgi:putative transposase
MPDHIHLFVARPPSGSTLSQWMKALRSCLGKTLLAQGQSKPHWQRNFFDHVIRSSESYSQKWEYVRMNPVRAELCKDPYDWPYQGEIIILRFD